VHLTSLVLLLFTLPLGATVFQKQPVSKQIQEADGIVIGHYLRSKSIPLDDGNIATQMIFKMNREVGMQSDLFGMDEIIVHYPGGRLGDKEVRVEGVPEFIPGENVVLMIKSKQDRYWGMNLGFGTFKIVNYGNERLIVNTIFPEDRNVGQMKIEDFEREVKLIKGSSFKAVVSSYPIESDRFSPQRSPSSLKQGKNRAIASHSEQDENNQSHSVNTMWLLFSLALMGGLFRLFRQKTAN
jgi:hypothetical protein